ncbi:sensor histidine kinase [Virgisporangium ochraceum]|uniref:histidine kinase n=1 Tax=Virgisporangium ochraceum TaxID=65505 RepID=A0A8J4EA73_9ACTN|nr:DUF4118 domain-containing protein [Virgisporangium ochraceum]GIJ67436.1 histidine kinase [Virgisporangium ochraceum]
MRWMRGLLAGAVMAVGVTIAVALLDPHLPALTLLVLYVLPVLAVAVRWGAAPAAVTALLSTVLFGYLSLPTRGGRLVVGSSEAVALALFLVTAVVVGTLAARLRHAAEESARLGEEQAALRRVATLVARGAEQQRVLAAVAEEVGALIGAQRTEVLRFEVDGTAAFVGGHGWAEDTMRRLGERRPVAPSSVAATVRETGRPARADDVAVTGLTGGADDGLRWAVASPILVAGRLWGAVTVASNSGAFPADTEQWLSHFTEIVAIAIANAESRTELTASRARVIAAGDAIRRRLERDLHDGAQQRLVSLALELRQVQMTVEDDLPAVGADLGRLADDLTEALDELRELSQGVHPAALSAGGLGPALRTLARRASLPVEVDVRTPDRFPERIEVSAYYVTTEAVTNAIKHAGASYVEVVVERTDAGLRLTVRDDGAGGADPRRGSGLTGLRDRVEAIGGSIHIDSPPGAGTLIDVCLPFTP